MSEGRVVRADPRLSEMRRRYLAGASLNEVGRQFGITGERVRRLFREAGLRSRSPAEATALRTRERATRDAAIVKRVEQVRDIEKVAHDFAASSDHVRRLLRREAPQLSVPPKNSRVTRGYW